MIQQRHKLGYFVGAILLSTTSAYAQTAGEAPAAPADAQTVAQQPSGVAPSDAVSTTPSPSATPTQQAENAEATGLGDIVVTAQRRSERLQDVPIAVSAFTAQDLETRQVSNTLDLVSYVPNLIGHNNTSIGTANTYALRGLANTESIATFDPPVGTYVDDIYVSRQGANNFSFFDVERIEVLRGPQGTLFGRNTTGGAINVILRKPSDHVTGYAEAGYGRYNRARFRGSVDLPISSRLLTKFSGYYISADGYVNDRVTGEKLNGEESYGLRGAVRALVSDDLTWDVSADYVDSSVANFPNFYDPKNDERISFTPLRKDTPIGANLVSSRLADNKLGNTAKSYSVSSNLAINVGDNTTINVITGYRHLFQEFLLDSFAGTSSASLVLDGVNYVSSSLGFATPLPNDSWHKQFSQEVKVNGKALGGFLDYVAGFYYINETNETDFANITLPLTGPSKATVSGDRTVFNDTEAYAGYAQGDFHLTSKLTFTAGLRYTDEHKTIRYQPNASPLPRSSAINQPFDTGDVVAAGIPVVLNAREFTPRFALKYDIIPDVNVYASATRGFKSGGWNARAYYAAAATAFTQETIWSYEGGLRSEFFDHRLRANLTGFYFTDYDQQLPGGGLDPVTGTVTYLTRNVADLRNYGFEAELSANPGARAQSVLVVRPSGCVIQEFEPGDAGPTTAL